MTQFVWLSTRCRHNIYVLLYKIQSCIFFKMCFLNIIITIIQSIIVFSCHCLFKANRSLNHSSEIWAESTEGEQERAWHSCCVVQFHLQYITYQTRVMSYSFGSWECETLTWSLCVCVCAQCFFTSETRTTRYVVLVWLCWLCCCFVCFTSKLSAFSK